LQLLLQLLQLPLQLHTAAPCTDCTPATSSSAKHRRRQRVTTAAAVMQTSQPLLQQLLLLLSCQPTQPLQQLRCTSSANAAAQAA
jgi:hypothetical protein